MSEEAWEGRKESQQADQQQPIPPESQQPEFVIHIRALATPPGARFVPPIQRLKLWLKAGLRAHGLRCTRCVEVTEEGEEPVGQKTEEGPG